MAIISTINTSSTKANFFSKTMEENIASMAYDMRLQKEFTCVQVNGSHRYDSNGVCVYCGKDNPPMATLKTGSELNAALLTAMPSGGGTVTFLGQNDIVDESTYSSKCSLASEDSYAGVTGYTNSGKTAMVVKCADAFAIKLNEDSAGAFKYNPAGYQYTLHGLNNLKTNNVVNANNLFHLAIVDLSELANWDVSNVKDASYMFMDCSDITDVSPLANWKLSSITTIKQIFADTSVTDATCLENWAIDQNHVDTNNAFPRTCTATPSWYIN